MFDIRIELPIGAGLVLASFLLIYYGAYDYAAMTFGMALVVIVFLSFSHITLTSPVTFLIATVFTVSAWLIFVWYACPPTYTGIASSITGWFDNLIGGIQDSISRFFNRLWDGFTAWLARWGLTILVAFVGLISLYIALVYLSNRRQL